MDFNKAGNSFGSEVEVYLQINVLSMLLQNNLEGCFSETEEPPTEKGG